MKGTIITVGTNQENELAYDRRSKTFELNTIGESLGPMEFRIRDDEEYDTFGTSQLLQGVNNKAAINLTVPRYIQEVSEENEKDSSQLSGGKRPQRRTELRRRTTKGTKSRLGGLSNNSEEKMMPGNQHKLGSLG